MAFEVRRVAAPTPVTLVLNGVAYPAHTIEVNPGEQTVYVSAPRISPAVPLAPSGDRVVDNEYVRVPDSPVDKDPLHLRRRTTAFIGKDYTGTDPEGHGGVEVELITSVVSSEGNESNPRDFDVDHMPCIDIDFPVRSFPSETPGHSHVFIDKALSWEEYRRLLGVLVEVGLVEKGYVEASSRRGETHIAASAWKHRLPEAQDEVRDRTERFRDEALDPTTIIEDK